MARMRVGMTLANKPFLKSDLLLYYDGVCDPSGQLGVGNSNAAWWIIFRLHRRSRWEHLRDSWHTFVVRTTYVLGWMDERHGNEHFDQGSCVMAAKQE